MSAFLKQKTDSNVKAISFMVFSMLAFAIDDMFIKFASGGANAGQIIFIHGIISFLLFYAVVRRNKENFSLGLIKERPILVRTLGDMVGASCMVLGIILLPLSNASAILQFQPLVVTLGAALFLGEVVRWRRWSAIIAGFIGVMIIIRPGLEGFQPASLIVLGAVFGLAIRDLATRVIRQDVSTSAISAIDGLALIVAGYVIHLFIGGSWNIPLEALAYICIAALFGTIGYYAITMAVRMGEISSVAPYRYTRLPFAMLLGFFVFSERPDFFMIVGSVIIVAAGIYTLYRERKIT